MREEHKRIDWAGTPSRKSGAKPEAASAFNTQKRPLCLSHSARHPNCQWHCYKHVLATASKPHIPSTETPATPLSLYFLPPSATSQPLCCALACCPDTILYMLDVRLSRSLTVNDTYPFCCIIVRLVLCRAEEIFFFFMGNSVKDLQLSHEDYDEIIHHNDIKTPKHTSQGHPDYKTCRRHHMFGIHAYFASINSMFLNDHI